MSKKFIGKLAADVVARTVKYYLITKKLAEKEKAMFEALASAYTVAYTCSRAISYSNRQTRFVNETIGKLHDLILSEEAQIEKLKSQRKLVIDKDETLQIKKGEDLKFEIVFSMAVPPSPQVFLGDIKAEIESAAVEGKEVWTATVDTNAISVGSAFEKISVSAVDYSGKALDANPATRARLDEDGKWLYYESDSAVSERQSKENGGPDTTHKIKIKKEEAPAEKTEAKQPIEAAKRYTTLDGLWRTYGVGVIVRITQVGNSITAVCVYGSDGQTNRKAGDVAFTGTLDGSKLTGKIRSWKLRKAAPDDTGDWSDLTIEISSDYNYMRGEWLVPSYHVRTGELFPRDRWTWEDINYSRIERIE